VAGDRAPVSTAAFWEGLYAARQDGWELGEPAPALVQRLDAGLPLPPGTRVAVPGAGRGHDARLLARRGYQVTGFDFAEAAVREARRLAEEEGVRVAFERRDVFSLATDYGGAFDAVWEYTCFCAIDPARRGGRPPPRLLLSAARGHGRPALSRFARGHRSRPRSALRSSGIGAPRGLPRAPARPRVADPRAPARQLIRAVSAC